MAWELLLFLAGALAVLVGCLLPSRWLPALPNDKLLHFLAFGTLTFLAVLHVHDVRELMPWVTGLFLFGGAIEVLQSLVPGRAFCARDLAANTLGIVMVLPLSSLMLPH